MLAHHADLKEDQDEDALCLVRLHKEEDIDGADRVDLAGWREISRENFIGLRDRWSAIILLSVLVGRLLLCRCRSYCQPATSLNGWRRCWGYEAQDTKNFELIVADDGTRKETYDMLQRITPQLSFQVKPCMARR